jgi:hypothetical protein
MKYIFASFLLPFYLGLASSQTLAGEYKSQSSPIQNSSSSPNGGFYTVAKKLLFVNYSRPMQTAILFRSDFLNAIPQAAPAILKVAEKYINLAKAGFPQDSKFNNPRETAAALDKFAYDLLVPSKRVPVGAAALLGLG